jgi:hypothetical protein
MKKLNKILKQIQEKVDFCEADSDNMLSNLQGSDMSDYELVDSREVSDENSSTSDWIKSHIELAVIKQDANAKSKLDENEFKVRYSYTQKHSSTNSRDFCKEMMSRTNNGVVYRFEDIAQASFQGINKSHGHNGKPYSLFKYKGGVHCHHVWEAQLYKLKTKPNGENVADKGLASSDEITPHSTHYSPKPDGLNESKTAPMDMPNDGHHPDWGK